MNYSSTSVRGDPLSSRRRDDLHRWGASRRPGAGRRWATGLLGAIWLLGTSAACGDDPAQVEHFEAPEAPSRLNAPGAAAPLAPVSRIDSADVWLDLLAQRPSAGTTEGERFVVDLGLPQARKYLELGARSNWSLAEDVDGYRAGILVGQGGSLDLPIDGALAAVMHAATVEPPEDVDVDGAVEERPTGKAGADEPPPLAMAITLKALAPDQVVTVFWQEQVLANLTLGPGWQRRTFSLPERLTKVGDNRLRLHFRRVGERGGRSVSAAIRTVEVGAHGSIVSDPPLSGAPPYQVDNTDIGAPVLSLSSGAGLVYYVQPPRRSRLRLDVRGRGSIEVLASTDEDHTRGRPPTSLLQEPLKAAGDRHEVDLSGYGGMPLRLEVRVRSRGDEAQATFKALEIISQRAIPVDRRRRALRELVVLAVEGARADDLLGASSGSPRYPAVERLLSEALVFERAYSIAPWAISGHAGWLSSVIPPVHKTVKGTYVADTQTLLTEVLDRAGYATLGVTADLDFSADRGLSQGFDEVLRLARGSSQRNDANAVVAAGIEAWAGRGDPKMTYAIVSDPQAPYEPPRELQGELSRPSDAPLPHLTHLWLGRVRTGKIEPTAKELAYVRRLYRGELQVVDQALGQIIAELEREGRLDEAIIVVVGLHGEEFLEHGGAGHGFSLYDEVLRVPLLIRAPALLAPGRVTAPVDLLDLAPTLVDLLGLPFPAEWQGESLVPVIDDPQPPPRLLVAYMGDGSRAAIVGDSKLILGSGRGLEAQRFYDLGRDPGEQVDRLAEGGIALRMVRTALAWHLAEEGRWKRARWGTGADLRPAFALDHGM